MGMAYAYGWGSTGHNGAPCADKTFPDVLQETELRICTAAESEAYSAQGPLLDSQLCTVGATSDIYSVNIKIM